jgi:hypothetical protein
VYGQIAAVAMNAEYIAVSLCRECRIVSRTLAGSGREVKRKCYYSRQLTVDYVCETSARIR